MSHGPPSRRERRSARARDQLRFGEYLIGLEGLALLRMGAAGRVDRADERIREIVDLAARLEEPALAASRYLPPAGARSGYAVWAATYDERDNPLIRIEEPAIRPLLAGLPPGRALDAACGTGRLTAYLAERHEVTGVDASAEMLARAREKLPEVEFVEGDLAALPVPDAEFASAVCALALSHVSDLGRPVAELARVVVPGGRVVISNVHPFVTGVIGWRAWFANPDGSRGFIPEYPHRHSAYIEAFSAAGLEVQRCLEPPIPPELARAMGAGWVDDAAEIGVAGTPGVLIWELVRTS
jgi:SAM-dependent methyltransferase